MSQKRTLLTALNVELTSWRETAKRMGAPGWREYRLPLEVNGEPYYLKAVHIDHIECSMTEDGNKVILIDRAAIKTVEIMPCPNT